MKSFKLLKSFNLGGSAQVLDPVWENRILQFFNLSRGRLYPVYPSRGGLSHHTLVERLKNLKDLNYLYIHQWVSPSGPTLKDLEVVEGFPGPDPDHLDLTRPRVRALAAHLAGRRDRLDLPNPRRSA